MATTVKKSKQAQKAAKNLVKIVRQLEIRAKRRVRAAKRRKRR